MKYEVVLSNQAELDVRGLYEYIAYEKHAPEIAATLLGRIEKQVLKLDEMPYRYRKYEMEPWRSRELRMMPIENFIAFYIPDDENRTVTVIRILYYRQNAEEQLKKTSYE